MVRGGAVTCCAQAGRSGAAAAKWSGAGGRVAARWVPPGGCAVRGAPGGGRAAAGRAGTARGCLSLRAASASAPRSLRRVGAVLGAECPRGCGPVPGPPPRAGLGASPTPPRGRGDGCERGTRRSVSSGPCRWDLSAPVLCGSRCRPSWPRSPKRSVRLWWGLWGRASMGRPGGGGGSRRKARVGRHSAPRVCGWAPAAPTQKRSPGRVLLSLRSRYDQKHHCLCVLQQLIRDLTEVLSYQERNARGEAQPLCEALWCSRCFGTNGALHWKGWYGAAVHLCFCYYCSLFLRLCWSILSAVLQSWKQ